jgi:hypothetical protein
VDGRTNFSLATGNGGNAAGGLKMDSAAAIIQMIV